MPHPDALLPAALRATASGSRRLRVWYELASSFALWQCSSHLKKCTYRCAGRDCVLCRCSRSHGRNCGCGRRNGHADSEHHDRVDHRFGRNSDAHDRHTHTHNNSPNGHNSDASSHNGHSDAHHSDAHHGYTHDHIARDRKQHQCGVRCGLRFDLSLCGVDLDRLGLWKHASAVDQ